MRALLGLVSGGALAAEDEQLVIQTVRNRRLKREDVERLLQPLEASAQALPSLRVLLVELKGDFV